MLISGIQRFTMLDFPDHTAAIIFTPGCNMRCKFCHNKEFVLPEEIQKIRQSFITEDAVMRFLQKRKGLLDGVVISGGEPTMQPNLMDFMQRVRSLGFLVKLDTNGNRADVLQKIIDSKLADYIAMDAKTSLDTYIDLVGPMVNITQVQKSMDILKRNHIPYEFRTTLIKEFHTPKIITNMTKMLDGAHALYLQSFRSANTLDPSFSKHQPFSPSEMDEIRKQFQKVIPHVFIR